MAEEQIIIEVIVDNDAARKNIESQTSNIVALENQIKSLQSSQKLLNKQNKQNSTEYKQNSELIALNKAELNSANKSRKDSIKDIGLVSNSLNAQKAALKANKIAIGDVNTATKQGQKEYKKLEKDIVRQTKALRKAENAQGTFTRGVGDYGQALNQVSPALGGAVTGFQSMTKGALAFIATPIGAVIGTLGLAIGALTAYFKGSEEGENNLLKITNTLSSVFEAFADVVRDVGESIFNAITSPKEVVIELGNLLRDQVINRIKALGLAGKAIARIFSGEVTEGFKDLGESSLQYVTGVEDVIGKTKELADETVSFFDKTQKKVEENISRANEISKIQIQLAKDERNLLIENAKLDVQIANKRLDAKDEETRTAAERIKLLEDAQVLENKSFDNQIKLAQARLNIQIKQNAQSDSTKEDLQNQANLEAELIRLQQSRANAQRKLETEIQTNIKKRDAAINASAKITQDAIDKEKQSAFELSVYKRELAANELTDAQEKADALILIEQDKSLKLLENERLTASEKLLIERQSLQTQNEIQEEADESKQEDVDKDKELNKSKRDAAVGLASQTLNAIASLSEEGSAIAKAAAIGDATINTAKAVTNTLANVPAPLNVPAAVVTGALGAVQIANIAGVFEDGGITKFAKGGLSDGGMFKGASHKNGGIKFAVGSKIHEAEDGEAIINKRSTAMFKPLLSSINTAGGGVAFANEGIPLASSSTSSLDSAIRSESSISNQLLNQVPIEVSVEDINKVQSNVRVKQNKVSI